MGPCEHNADRWLDHLYGRRSDRESPEMADHLALCTRCQAALAEAQRDQQRTTRAALSSRTVPECHPPTAEARQGSASLTSVARPVASPPTPGGPPVRNPLRRSLAQRLWPVWVAAAALRLAIFFGIDRYQRGG